MRESQKINHTGQLEFHELVTREQSGNTVKIVLKIILRGTNILIKTKQNRVL